MAIDYIPPARALMLSPDMPLWTRLQHPLALVEDKLHIYPDWYSCSREYETTYSRRWGNYGTFNTGSFIESWRSPFDEEPDMSEKTYMPFEIRPIMLIVFKDLFANKNDPEGAFKSFVSMAEEVWGTTFKYADDKDYAYAVCPSDVSPQGNGGDPFIDKAIPGSVCFCTKVNCTDKESTGGYNTLFKDLMLSKGYKTCYIVCEVDPNGLEFSKKGYLRDICPKDDSLDTCSKCIKGLMVFGGSGEEIDMAAIEGESQTIPLYMAYLTFTFNNPDAPMLTSTAYRQYIRATKSDNTNWPKGELPHSLPILNYIATKGELTKKVAVQTLGDYANT